MQLQTYFLVLCACVLKLVSTSVNVADVPCGRSQIRSAKIKGGTDAVPHQYPWVVSISTSGPNSPHFCGGSLVHKRFVITAAHCVHHKRPQDVQVLAGAHNVLIKDDKTVQSIPVSNIVIHSNYSKKYINDIAILELSQDAQWTKFVRPVCLADMELDTVKDSLNGLSVTAVGWGNTDEKQHGGRPAAILQKVDVVVVPTATCENWYNIDGVRFYDSHLCAGYENGGKDTCQGDSGGPLMMSDNEGRMTIVGVVSTGIGCGRPKTPGIYTRVSRYISWIQNNMTQLSARTQ
ncbi:trypsin-1-like [Palaemon carinicauda]|uniref:trypsin-1-like n=1 Tax=Palaemon carinicauda TaxID=392227 RepID=UPI0035B5BF38